MAGKLPAIKAFQGSKGRGNSLTAGLVRGAAHKMQGFFPTFFPVGKKRVERSRLESVCY